MKNNLQYKMFLLNVYCNRHSTKTFFHLQYKMFLLNGFVQGVGAVATTFTIQNVPIK